MARTHKKKAAKKTVAKTVGKAETGKRDAPDAGAESTKTIFVQLPPKIAEYGGAFYDSSSGTRIGGKDPIEVPDTLFVRSKIVDGELLLVSKAKEEESSEGTEKPEAEEKTEGAD